MRISDWSSDVCSSDLTHPVYSLSITGSSNAHELLSASTDGRLCQWNLSLLDEPTVSTQLRAESKHLDGELDAAVKPVFVTCFAYNQTEASRELVLGSESGILYRSEEHTSELQSLMRISYAVFCLKNKTTTITTTTNMTARNH